MGSGMQCSVPITQSDMADMLGLSLVHTNRSVSALRIAGMITLESFVLTVIDLARLQETANFDPRYLHLPCHEHQPAAVMDTSGPGEDLAA